MDLSRVLSLYCVLCLAGSLVTAWDWTEGLKQQIVKAVLEKSDTINSYEDRIEKVLFKKGVASSGFSWSSCGSSSDVGVINKMSVSPMPLQIPGLVNVSFAGSLKQDLKAPIQVELEVKKKVLVWITVPCVEEMGSCTYDDLCALLAHIQCPASFRKHNIPCKCPMKAGSYSLPPSNVHLHPIGLPEWLSEGDYKANIKVTASGKQVICLNVQFSLK